VVATRLRLIGKHKKLLFGNGALDAATQAEVVRSLALQKACELIFPPISAEGEVIRLFCNGYSWNEILERDPYRGIGRRAKSDETLRRRFFDGIAPYLAKRLNETGLEVPPAVPAGPARGDKRAPRSPNKTTTIHKKL